MTPTNVNEAPTALTISSSSCAEETLGATIGTLTGTDPDASSTLTFSVPSGSGYRIIDDSGAKALALAADRKLDLEDASVRGAYASRTVTVTVTDNGSPGLTKTLDVTVTPTNVNEKPTALTISNSTCEEETLGAAIGTLTGTDPDASDNLTYSVPSGSGYQIVSGTTLALANNRKLDVEDASQRGQYASRLVRVTVTDVGGLSTFLDVTVTPTNINDPPSVLTCTVSAFDEETAGATVGTLSASDPDAGDTLSFSVPTTSGYEVTGTTLKLAVGKKLDREDSSVRGDYVSRTVTVTVTDAGGLTKTLDVTLTPDNVNEVPTALTFSQSAFNEETAGATVGTVSGTDPDAGDTLTYSVPTDSGYTVTGTSLKLAAGKKLDLEDSSVRGDYVSRSVTVTVTDAGGLTRTLAVTVTPTNVNEVPTALTFTASAFDEEVAGVTVGTLSGSDPDAGDTLTYSVPGGSGYRIVGGTSLALADGRKLDLENSAVRGDYVSRSVTVTVTDAGGLTKTLDVTVTPVNVNEAPTVLTFTPSAFNEETPGSSVGLLAGTDPDAGDTLTYSVPVGSGYRIVGGTTLALADGKKLDLEDSSIRGDYSSRSVTVTVTDAGGLSTSLAVTVTPTDINEAPNGLTLATQNVSFSEDLETAASVPVTTVLTLVATDPDAGVDFRGNVFALAPSASTDIADRFQVTATGALQRKAGVVFDYETGPTTYTVPIVISDSANPSLKVETSTTVTITPGNDPLWIPSWEVGSVALADPTQAVLIASGLTPRDQDYLTEVTQIGSNDLRLRFALYPIGADATPSRGAGEVDRNLHALGFSLASSSGLTASGDLSSTLQIRVTAADPSSTPVAEVSIEGGDARVLNVVVKGNHASGTPVLTQAQLTSLVQSVTYRVTLAANQTARTVSDIVVEAATQELWNGSRVAWQSWRRISPSTANQRPTLSGAALAGVTVARDSSVTVSKTDLVIGDDYPELGEELLLAYPPLFGQIVGDGGAVIVVGGMIPVSPTTVDPVGGGDFTLRYVPNATGTAVADSFIVQVRDRGVNVNKDGQRTSELYVITVSITPGSNPSVTAVVSSSDVNQPVFRERQTPVSLLPAAAQVNAGSLTQITGWSLFAGPKPTSATVVTLTRPLSRFSVVTGAVSGGTVAVDGQRVTWTADAGDDRAGALIDPLWNGVGRTLLLRLDDGTSLVGATALARAIGFSLDGHRISNNANYADLAIGFVATADPTRFTLALPSVVVQGSADVPVFTPANLVLRVGSSGTVVGVSEVSDADGLADPATWLVSPGSSQLEVLATQVTAPTEITDDAPARYRITWALTPSAVTSTVTLSFSDDVAAIAAKVPSFSATQTITVEQVGSGNDAFAFISNPPYHQRRGERILLPLILAGSSGTVPDSDTVTLALTFPVGTNAEQRSALARIFTPVPSSRQLQVDLSASDAPAAGSTLSCVLTANRTSATGVQVAEQPILLRVLPPLPTMTKGVN